jgi:hypothetical protein
MGTIILIRGANSQSLGLYPEKTLGRPESYPAPPFWLDLAAPSKTLMTRISKVLQFDREVVRSCFFGARMRSCHDFGDYLFVQTFLLEPSNTHLFIQRPINIILSREHLITVHKSRTFLPDSCSFSRISVAARTGTLVLALLDIYLETVVESFCSEEQMLSPMPITDGPPEAYPMWWRLKSFKAVLYRDANLLQRIAIAGKRFFDAEDMRLFDSIKSQIRLLSDMTARLLSRMHPPVDLLSTPARKQLS